jgi:STE24 endopeptidase
VLSFPVERAHQPHFRLTQFSRCTFIHSFISFVQVAVLAHELGHWAMNHTVKNLIVSLSYLLLTFYLFGQVLHSTPVFESFGFHSTQPAMIGFVLFGLVQAPLSQAVSFCMHALSRRFEFQADAYAAAMGKGVDLKAALAVLQRENKAPLHVDPWYAT